MLICWAWDALGFLFLKYKKRGHPKATPSVLHCVSDGTPELSQLGFCQGLDHDVGQLSTDLILIAEVLYGVFDQLLQLKSFGTIDGVLGHVFSFVYLLIITSP